MTNKERYQRAFGTLRASEKIKQEAIEMANNREQAYKNYRSYLRGRRIVVAVVAMVLVLAMTAVAYAATDGQLFQMVRVFINGQERDATVYMNDDGSLSIGVEPGDKVEIDAGPVTLTTVESAVEDGAEHVVTVLPFQAGVDEGGPYADVAGQRLGLEQMPAAAASVPKN